MKATSVQNIKNVKDISFTIENNPAELESKLIIVAGTNDDIFAFEFEGSDLTQQCKAAGLFTGWEKDQKIRELEKEKENQLKAKNKEINKLKQQLQQVEDDKERLTERYKALENKFDNVEPFRSLERTLREKQQLKEEYKELQRMYNLEQATNEAQYKFINEYAGKGTEIEFDFAIGETEETSYVIVDKERYQTLKAGSYCAIIHGKIYNTDQLVDRILELEKLKTPTIENFADEEPHSRRDILRCAEKCVCGQREQDYGTPESNFQLIADLWNGYLGGKTDNPVISVTPVDVSMMMALLKIARIRNGGGSGDSFVDLAGYAACGGEIWAGNKKS